MQCKLNFIFCSVLFPERCVGAVRPAFKQPQTLLLEDLIAGGR